MYLLNQMEANCIKINLQFVENRSIVQKDNMDETLILYN